jgi:hypothetical protein
MAYPIEHLNHVAKWAGEHSVEAAEREFNMADGTIRKAMIRLGIPRRRPGNLDTYPPELRKSAVNRILYGRRTYTQVSMDTGIPQKYLWELVRKRRKERAQARQAS